MHRRVTLRSLDRAQWHSDLANALVEADHLLCLLEIDRGYPVEMARLRRKVQTLRSELELLNRVILTRNRIIEAPWPDAARNY